MNKDYQDALERAKSIKDSIIASHNKESASYYTGFIDNIFPELKESEDERTRKELIEYLTHKAEVTGFINEEKDCKRWIAYLEKQKEQSITENDLDEEVHRFFDDCIVVHEAKLYGNISERVIPVDCYELTARHFAKWGEQQKEQNPVMIQWTGKNLKEVINFTGKSPRFGEWFKSWEEFETYVHQHNDILKLFCEDGSHYEVPAGAWIVKTPDGYNVPSVARFIHAKQEQPEVDLDFQVFAKEMDAVFNLSEEVTENTEENPLNWEYAIARHFFELGLNARKEK